MLAACIHGFGSAADVLSLDHVASAAAPAAGEVRLAMLAAPINPADLDIIEGTYDLLPEPPAILGNEGVGRVEAVGPGVTTLRPGDLAAPLDPGAWCQARTVSADRVIPLPAGIDPHQAAMLVVNPPTAHAMIHDFATLRPGDWIAQNAANSGVGRCVIQLARHLGLRTLNVVRRPEPIDELLALGADHVVLEKTDLRRDGRALMNGAEARLGLNAVGGASALNVANALAAGGPLVTYGAMSRQPVKIPNGLLIFRDLHIRGFWLRRWFREKPAAEQHRVFAELARLAAAGAIHVPIHCVLPLRDIHAALVEAATGRRAGKVLLDLRES